MGGCVVEEHQVGERGPDTSSGDVPWLSILDPTANARALGEIQRRGLHAAGELVDRLIGAVDGERHEDPAASAGSPVAAEPTPADGTDGANGSDGDALPTTRPSVHGSPSADLMQVWMDVFQRGLQAMAAMARPDGALVGGDSIVTADVGRGTATGALHISVVAAGSDGVAGGLNGPSGRSASAEVWLHNGTSRPMIGLRLHSGDLRSHDGTTLPASGIRFDPPSLDELPARTSRGVQVLADVADEVPGGVYRGIVLAAGAPEVWLPIVVTVASGE
jgi:hypothetical protein